MFAVEKASTISPEPSPADLSEQCSQGRLTQRYNILCRRIMPQKVLSARGLHIRHNLQKLRKADYQETLQLIKQPRAAFNRSFSSLSESPKVCRRSLGDHHSQGVAKFDDVGNDLRVHFPVPASWNPFHAIVGPGQHAADRAGRVGVEFIALASTVQGAPQLDGHLFNYVGEPNRYGLPAFYELHVWAWKQNPNGAFVNWHPNVSCQSYSGTH